ncbi:hypothetical protein EYC84_001446 [Monilinia fructicola]|uniref:Uncharacterized protein n=1 Tax=Monilinia fructicola TaxID=38448 RepID=A0A5M9JXE4_MONFR|nr:hypothetical protein EYC84_001446 [Monilinia fructicola]
MEAIRAKGVTKLNEAALFIMLKELIVPRVGQYFGINLGVDDLRIPSLFSTRSHSVVANLERSAFLEIFKQASITILHPNYAAI